MNKYFSAPKRQLTRDEAIADFYKARARRKAAEEKFFKACPPIAPYRPMSRTASILVGVSIIMLTMTILMGTVTLLLLQHG